MRLFRTFILLISLLGGLLAPAHVSRAALPLRYPKLSQEGLAEVAEISAKIFNECPPRKCLPVFVGRSSVLISAFLEATKDFSSLMLPLSGLGSLSGNALFDAEKKFTELVLVPFLNKSLETGSFEQVMVIDYVNRGNTVERVSSWIDAYVHQYSPNINVSTFSYGGALPSEAVERLKQRHISLKSAALRGQSEGHLQYLIKNSMVEIYAPYGAWMPLSESVSPKVDRQYRKPYIYRDGPNSPTLVASYQDIVDWFKDVKLGEKLPTSAKLFCDNVTKHAGTYQDFTN